MYMVCKVQYLGKWQSLAHQAPPQWTQAWELREGKLLKPFLKFQL